MGERAALFAAGLLLLTGLTLPLTAPDETRYSEVPANMAAGGSWLVPERHGRPYLDKPPLHYWLVAASFKALGPRSGLVRWPSVASAALTAAVLYLLGRKLFDSRLAFTATTLLMVMPGFQFAAHYGNLDALFALLTTLCQLSLWIAFQRTDETSYGWIVGAGVSCGLAILTKGPVALVIAVPPLLAWDWLRRHRIRWGAWAAFAATVMAVAGPWFIAISRMQPGFWRHFFIRHHVDRFAGTLEHQQAWWFYLPILIVGALPFSLLVPSALAGVFRADPGLRRQRTETLGVALMAASWPVLFFSLSSGKLASYILPSLPFLALLLAWYLHLEPRPHARLHTAFLASIPFAVGVGLLLAGPRIAGPFPTPWDRGDQMLWCAIWLVMLATCWTLRTGRLATASIAALLLNAQLLTTALPAAAEATSLYGRAATQARRLSSDEPLPVVVIADERDHLLFRERYPMLVLQLAPEDHRSLEVLLDASGELIVVTEPRHVAWLQGHESYRVRSVDGREHIFHALQTRRVGSGA